MNAIITQLVLLLIRHGIVAVGLEKLLHDPEVEAKIGASAAIAVGLVWSFIRKLRQPQSTASPAEVKAGGGSAALLVLLLLTGCVTAPDDKNANRWQQISRAAGYGGSISWLKDHPQDCAKFASVADELAVMSKQDFVIVSDFLRVARQLPVKELRDNANVLLITEFVVIVMDSNGALESEKVQLQLKPIISGAATGIRLAVDRFCNKSPGAK